MTSYPFIEDLFSSIMKKSRAIQGRFFMCPRYGVEISSDQLEQVLTDEVKPITGSKYPLALMMPPRSVSEFLDNQQWEHYRAVMFFLTTSYTTGTGQVKTPNKATRTSTHTIPQDWHDMKRAAIGFIRVLDIFHRKHRLHTNLFRLGGSGKNEKILDPVSLTGLDRVSGIRLDFSFSLFTGCELEDYNINDIDSITVPPADSHPEHKL